MPHTSETPLVSVIVPTRDRPQFLPIALACYAHQTYPECELIVADDGVVAADEAAIARAGGRLLRLPQDMALGAKLNHAVLHARGTLIQRMDDDDYYAPDFIQRLVDTILDDRIGLCRPIIAGMLPILFFDLVRWELRIMPPRQISGATILFYRSDWVDSPFRPILRGEDGWFLDDLARLGGIHRSIPTDESAIAIRHGHHTWTHLLTGPAVHDSILSWERHQRNPEVVFPQWAQEAYRSIRADLVDSTHSLM